MEKNREYYISHICFLVVLNGQLCTHPNICTDFPLKQIVHENHWGFFAVAQLSPNLQ